MRDEACILTTGGRLVDQLVQSMVARWRDPGSKLAKGVGQYRKSLEKYIRERGGDPNEVEKFMAVVAASFNKPTSWPLLKEFARSRGRLRAYLAELEKSPKKQPPKKRPRKNNRGKPAGKGKGYILRITSIGRVTAQGTIAGLGKGKSFGTADTPEEAIMLGERRMAELRG